MPLSLRLIRFDSVVGPVGLHVLYVTVRQTLLAAAAAATVNARSVCWRPPFTGENVILARLPKLVNVVTRQMALRRYCALRAYAVQLNLRDISAFMFTFNKC